MARKYQVFISSTFEDLKEERRQVMLKLLSAGCIPTGMECFNPGDADKWKLIKTVIDDSDYFILILGNRYGSAPAGGKSFTEMEYDYAVKAGKPIVALLQEDDAVVSQESKNKRRLLLRFRRKVADRIHVKFWQTPPDLANLVMDGIVHLKTTHETDGWIRAQTPGSKVERDCLSLGITSVYKHRSDATADMIADIQQSARSCRMYSGIYLASLVKNDDFLEALQKAAASTPEPPYKLTYCTLNPAAGGADRALMELWARRESASSVEELARRIRERGYRRFHLIRDHAGVEATYRYFANFVLTHSLLVIDDSIVYFTPYDWVHESGDNCLTLRLCGGYWANSFVTEADHIDREFSIPAPQEEFAAPASPERP
jgi:hypothetical protein